MNYKEAEQKYEEAISIYFNHIKQEINNELITKIPTIRKTGKAEIGEIKITNRNGFPTDWSEVIIDKISQYYQKNWNVKHKKETGGFFMFTFAKKDIIDTVISNTFVKPELIEDLIENRSEILDIRQKKT